MAVKKGSFVWYELMTSDIDAAQTFYAKVVGWTVEDAGMPGLRYSLAKVGNRQVAGLMGFPPDRGTGPVMWFGYILVADVDVMAQQVLEAGGAVVREPTDIPGVGRFAVVADPQGATFMLFRGSGEAAPDLPSGAPGSIGWRELRTREWESAFTFYQDLFGWTRSYAHDMGPLGIYQTFSAGTDEWTGGMMTSPEAAPPKWHFYFTVEDIDAAVERIDAAGGTVLNGPHQVPGDSWVVMARDPQGASFALTGGRVSTAVP